MISHLVKQGCRKGLGLQLKAGWRPALSRHFAVPIRVALLKRGNSIAPARRGRDAAG